WGLGFVFRSPVKSVSYRPSAGPSHFSLSGQREVTKRKATPVWRPPGILPYGSACGLRGFSTAHPCTGEEHARIVRASLRADPPPARRQTGAPLIGLPGRTAAGCQAIARWTMARADAIRWRGSLRAGSRVQRRVAQEAGGERRACSRPWMAEFAPADGFRATQGTGIPKECRRGSRVAFLLVTSLWRVKEK